MTTKELYELSVNFRASAYMLSGALHKLNNAIKRIEELAQANEGELTPQEAKRHQKLQEVYEKTFQDIGEVLNKFP